jgi:hypothetical protein
MGKVSEFTGSETTDSGGQPSQSDGEPSICACYRNIRKGGRGLVEIDVASADNVRRMFELFAFDRVRSTNHTFNPRD